MGNNTDIVDVIILIFFVGLMMFISYSIAKECIELLEIEDFCEENGYDEYKFDSIIEINGTEYFKCYRHILKENHSEVYFEEKYFKLSEVNDEKEN